MLPAIQRDHPLVGVHETSVFRQTESKARAVSRPGDDRHQTKVKVTGVRYPENLEQLTGR